MKAFIIFILLLILVFVIIHQFFKICNIHSKSKQDYRIKNSSTELTKVKVGIDNFESIDSIFETLKIEYGNNINGNPEGRIK